MAAPPVPPRPYDHGYDYNRAGADLAPPIPPLPPNFHDEDDDFYEYENNAPPPHVGEPLVAPRPHKMNQDVPGKMARTVDNSVDHQQQFSYTSMPDANVGGGGYRGPPPPDADYDSYNPGGFNFSPPPQAQGRARAPSEAAAKPEIAFPQAFPQAQPDVGSISASMANLSFDGPSRVAPPREPSVVSTYGPARKVPSPPRRIMQGPPSLTAPLPTIASLNAALPLVLSPSGDLAAKVEWCKDVLLLVRMSQQSASGGSGNGTDPLPGPIRLTSPELTHLTDIALPLIDQLATVPQGTKPPLHIAEAIYIRATIMSVGSFPQHIAPSPRHAFRDFERSARAGYHPAWFKLGRDYETFKDEAHAKDCFERGVKHGVESCLYRMGMAYLMGQLGLPRSPELAIPLLHRAATLASIDVPQPAYVYGLLLLNEFNQITVPAFLFAPLIPPSSTPTFEARKHLERSAYLHFSPAQYKLGHAYEFALPPFPFDALLSVQYYSLASQQGEDEADMALSKWFLCGAEGCFEKDEGLAFTFAEKAARKGLATAQFAMGYYLEVGVGGPKDIEGAKKWYRKAVSQGNTDAQERLSALDQAAPQALSRQEHDKITQNKLVRKRTQAKQRSEAAVGAGAPRMNGPGFASAANVNASQVVDVIRNNSLAERRGPSQGLGRGQVPPLNVGGRQGAQRPPPQQQQYPPPQQQQPLQYPQSRPPPHAVTLPEPTHAPTTQSQAQAQTQSYPQQPAHRHTYSLTDTGFIPPPGGQGLSPPSRRGGRAPSPAGIPPRQHRPSASNTYSPYNPPPNANSKPGLGRPTPTTTSPLQTPNLAPAPAPMQQPHPPHREDEGGVEEAVRPTADKYQTFAEMGIQSAKAEDKECVVM